MKRILVVTALLLSACTNGSGIEAEDAAIIPSDAGVQTVDAGDVDGTGRTIAGADKATDGVDAQQADAQSADTEQTEALTVAGQAAETDAETSADAAPVPGSPTANDSQTGADSTGANSPADDATTQTTAPSVLRSETTTVDRATTTTPAAKPAAGSDNAGNKATTTTAKATNTTQAPAGGTTPTTARPAATTTTAAAPAPTTAPASPPPPPPPPPSAGSVRPPVGPGDYLESFDTASSMSGLSFFVANGRMFNDRPEAWPGDHAAGGNCGNPFTTRTVSWPDPSTSDNRTTTTDPGDAAYWCAPGGAATGHMMTAFHTKGYAHLDFSPKQTFSNVRRVCYDVNATNLGNRQWQQVVVVRKSIADQFAPRLDWTKARFLEGGPGSEGLRITDGVFLFSSTQGGANVETGGGPSAKGNKTDKTVSDTKKRVTTCLTDRGAGQIEIVQERWSGKVDVTTLPGSFPAGQVRVVFQDLSYNPDKAEQESKPLHKGYTWHWDNLYVSSNAGATPAALSLNPNAENGVVQASYSKNADGSKGFTPTGSGLFCQIA